MRHRGSRLRTAGLALAIAGLSPAAALTRAFLARGNAAEFNGQVSWANAQSMASGALGVILVMPEKLSTPSGLAPERTTAMADDPAPAR